MVRAVELLVPATSRLAAAGVPDAARDARRLLAHAMGVRPDRLTLSLPEEVAEEQQAAFLHLIGRRERREPVSHLVGKRFFYGREFIVTRDVLDPRPETETLIEVALAEPFETVLDLGTGTGCILLTLLAERPDAQGIGVDISEAAVEIARRNAARYGLRGRASIHLGSWYDAIPIQDLSNRRGVGQGTSDEVLGQPTFDLIVSNPPYVPLHEIAELSPEVRNWEPRQALTDGGDGLDAYRAIIEGLHRVLRPGGRLAVEIGPGQVHDVVDFMRMAGLRLISVVQDMDGRDRVVLGRASPRPFMEL